MNITELEQHLLGDNLSVVYPSSDCSVCSISDDSGNMSMTIYDVFPGICLIYNDVHIPRCSIAIDHPVGNIIEIEHCREGRIECQDNDDFFTFLKEIFPVEKSMERTVNCNFR